ncbi:MAG: ribonuclease H [Actinomycetes bacterium]
MFTCQTCGETFDVRQDVLDRYPGWVPKQCMRCRNGKGGPATAKASKPAGRGNSASRTRDLTIAEVLEKFTDGPDTGVFTDGASEGNPGPGGWGAVRVEAGKVVAEDRGSEPHTTNNRMELTAMIAGLRMVEPGESVDIYTDSELVVNTLTKWAAGWEQRGWKRKTGPIANLELVQEAYRLYRERPGVRIKWVPAHSGYRWNEYADSLATAYRRAEL